MCGILGSFSLQSDPDQSTRLQNALRALNHRGPDDRGLEHFSMADGQLSLGHARLSIIDLSPGGHQPMSSPDGRYTIVFNGEIYNYRELRQELKPLGYSFDTDSDTEVLLAAWAHWGAECIQRLIGMFAFAVIDRESKVLSLVRDAFGIKPLFYAPSSDGILFASEMPSMLILRGEETHLNPQRVYDYLIHGVQDTGFNTFVRGVNHLPPAHLLQLDLERPSQAETKRWWNPSIARNSDLSFEQAAEQLRELFLESVKLHLRSDVPLGIALSGGVDSSAIACCVRQLEPGMDLHTFSYIGEHGSQTEEPWIDLINKKINAIPNKIRIQPKDLQDDLNDLMHCQGEPFGGTAMYAQWRIFQAAHESGMKVILEGQGGDEVLGGYFGYPGQMMLSFLERGEFRKLNRFSKAFHDWQDRDDLNPWRALIGQLIPDSLYNFANHWMKRSPLPAWLIRKEIEESNIDLRPFRPSKKPHNRGRRLVETLLQSLTINGLPHLLRYGDRNAMYYSIENRVPFLTTGLAEFLLTQPEEYLVSVKGESKSLFRAAMRGIVPDEILDRRDKIGFDTPMKEWMRHRILTDLNQVDTLRHQEMYLIDPERLIEYINNAFESSRHFNWQVWRIYNLIHWVQHSCLKR